MYMYVFVIVIDTYHNQPDILVEVHDSDVHEWIN